MNEVRLKRFQSGLGMKSFTGDVAKIRSRLLLESVRKCKVHVLLMV